MDNSPHIFFMGPQALLDRFWTEQANGSSNWSV